MTRVDALRRARNGRAAKETEAHGRVYTFLHGGTRTEGSNGDHAVDWRWLTPEEAAQIGEDGWIAWDHMRAPDVSREGSVVMKRTADERVEKARKDALWWRREVDTGRFQASLPEIEWVLFDLESAGGLR